MNDMLDAARSAVELALLDAYGKYFKCTLDSIIGWQSPYNHRQSIIWELVEDLQQSLGVHFAESRSGQAELEQDLEQTVLLIRLQEREQWRDVSRVDAGEGAPELSLRRRPNEAQDQLLPLSMSQIVEIGALLCRHQGNVTIKHLAAAPRPWRRSNRLGKLAHNWSAQIGHRDP